MATPNYFTCTLGQAAALDLTDKTFKNINAFIDTQADTIPAQPAIGFPYPADSSDRDSQWLSFIWTFSDVRRISCAVASQVKQRDVSVLQGSKTVALIAPSTPEFLFTWLALMRLGYAVLLIAPQCQPAAIAHLCKTCEARVLYYDEIYQKLADDAVTGLGEGGSLKPRTLPIVANTDYAKLHDTISDDESASIDQYDVAYLHHTSGTSSGVPKPIPQTHRAGCGVLPSFPDGREAATFTTTPLYHGGIADLFRAWKSGALIWMFPGRGIPITAGNVVRCLDAASRSSVEGSTSPVKYFSSVPYVLQSLEADEAGLRHLQRMDIVGVGGAALPTEVGDRLVRDNVSLISRFGSAECGFLLSSHRDFKQDREWQHLRSDGSKDLLRFEQQEEAQSELVVLKGWPHMAKTNREDDSFATADLFEAHATIPNAWRYHSRADSQLTLITGKKFDPAPLEGAIMAAASDLLDDVLIFGNGQPFPGALLFRVSSSATAKTDADIVDQIWPVIEKLNAESQNHARIPKRMLVPMAALQRPLEKSSKGTIIRGAAESRFEDEISRAYANAGGASLQDVADDKVLSTLIDLTRSIVSNKDDAHLDGETDLYHYGVDSVAAIQLRHGVSQLLPPNDRSLLPLNVVDDCGTIGRLAEFVIKRRHGQTVIESGDDDDEHKFMLELVDRYSDFDDSNSSPQSPSNGLQVDEQAEHDHDDQNKVVVLTGTTGALGAHLLDLYRSDTSVSKIYCLVRGADQHACTERVSKALEQRGLKPLDDSIKDVVVLRAQLGDPQLGLTGEQYTTVAREASHIVHVAWSVNFRMRLRSFEKENIASVTNLVNLALRAPARSRPPRFGYCSSTASVMSCSSKIIPESIVDEPSAASALGYSRSKWVAEQICGRADARTRLRGRVSIFRVGQLAGDVKRGVWNTKEAWPMMLSTIKVTSTLPDLKDEPLDWLPVDVAAEALLQGMTATNKKDADPESGDLTDVVHVLNPYHLPEWADLLAWMRKRKEFRTLNPKEWVELLEESAETTMAGHPALKLLDHWKRAYGRDGDARDEDRGVDGQEMATRTTFDMAKSRKLVPALRDVKPVEEQYFWKIWDWIDSNM